MPVMFTFGVLNVFNFTFRAGSSLADSTIDGKSTSSGNQDPKASKDLTAVVSPSLHGTGETDLSPYGTLSKFPREVRNMIYMNVLRYKRSIRKSYMFLDHPLPIMAADRPHTQAIDATLLRTSKAIYSEAVRILYGNNYFYFDKPSDIKEFAHAGLGSTPFGCYDTISKPSATIQSAPCGRLTMIRQLHLTLNSEHGGDGIKKLWSYWYDFFYPSEKQDPLVQFPALDRLILDVTDWKLNGQNAPKIRVKPFLRKLRPRRGLQHLTLLGVVHEQTLRDFKHGFVRQGGTFRPGSFYDKTVATTRVTHENLPEVSMCVRAIVDMDKASRTFLRNKKKASDSK